MNKKGFQIFTVLGISLMIGLHCIEFVTASTVSYSLQYRLLEWLPLYLIWGSLLVISGKKWQENPPSHRQNKRSQYM